MADRRVIVIAREDGSVARFPLRPKTEIYFERTYKISLTKLGDGSAATNLYHLAWEAERAASDTIVDFDTWLDTILEVSLETEEVRPTAPARPASGSHASPSPPESHQAT